MSHSSFVPTFTLMTFTAGAWIALKILSRQKNESSSTFKSKKPLSEVEQKFFHQLRSTLPNQVVLAQVAFSRFIYTDGLDHETNFRKNATAKQKVADYLICTTDFRILSVVELDDSTHDVERDKARDEILSAAGLKTIRYSVSRLPDSARIRFDVLGEKS